MTPTVAAELAMTLTFLALTTLSLLYVVPWVRMVGADVALPPLLAIHAFRHVALQLVPASQAGFPISAAGRDQIVYGDVAGMVLALAALVAVQRRWRMAAILTWLFIAAPATDLGNALRVGLRESCSTTPRTCPG